MVADFDIVVGSWAWDWLYPLISEIRHSRTHAIRQGFLWKFRIIFECTRFLEILLEHIASLYFWSPLAHCDPLTVFQIERAVHFIDGAWSGNILLGEICFVANANACRSLWLDVWQLIKFVGRRSAENKWRDTRNACSWSDRFWGRSTSFWRRSCWAGLYLSSIRPFWIKLLVGIIIFVDILVLPMRSPVK